MGKLNSDDIFLGLNASKKVINIPFSKNEIIREILKVLEKNNMKDDVHIRLIISRGEKITPYQEALFRHDRYSLEN